MFSDMAVVVKVCVGMIWCCVGEVGWWRLLRAVAVMRAG